MRIHKFCSAIALVLQFAAQAQDQVVPLYPAGKIPNWKDAGEQEKVEKGDITRYSLVQEPTLSVYLPSKKIATGQGVVICPGGGYGVLAFSWEGTDVAKWLNSKGIAAFVLKYRLPNAKGNINPRLTPLLDAQRAMRLVRAHASEWQVQPGKLGVMGFSAGGHLAATLGTQWQQQNAAAADSTDRLEARPDFMVLVYPVITMQRPYTHAGSRNNLLGAQPDTALVNQYSNELQVTAQTPPGFLVHATDDKGVPVENSLMMYQAMKNKGIPVEMHVYPYGGHGFAMGNGKGYLETWTDRLADWLRAINK